MAGGCSLIGTCNAGASPLGRVPKQRAETPTPHRLFPLFDLGPGVFQRDGAVENRLSQGRVEIDAEISQALELIAVARDGAGQRGLKLAVSQHLERIRVEIRGEILAFFGLIGIFLAAQILVNPYLGVYSVRG